MKPHGIISLCDETPKDQECNLANAITVGGVQVQARSCPETRSECTIHILMVMQTVRSHLPPTDTSSRESNVEYDRLEISGPTRLQKRRLSVS